MRISKFYACKLHKILAPSPAINYMHAFVLFTSAGLSANGGCLKSRYDQFTAACGKAQGKFKQM